MLQIISFISEISKSMIKFYICVIFQEDSVPECSKSSAAVWPLWQDHEEFGHGHVSNILDQGNKSK